MKLASATREIITVMYIVNWTFEVLIKPQFNAIKKQKSYAISLNSILLDLHHQMLALNLAQLMESRPAILVGQYNHH